MWARFALAALAFLALAPAAHAARGPCGTTVSDVRGAAPLRVSFRAGCASSKYRWTFGDGRVATGRTVVHTFAGGRFRPVLTTDSARHRLPAVVSVALHLVAPRVAAYGERVTLRATARPPLPIKLGTRAFRQGKLTLTVTQPFLTVAAGPAAIRRTLRVKPRLDLRLVGSPTIGAPLRVIATLRPAHAGRLQVTVDGVRTTAVPTTRVSTARVVAVSTPAPGWAATFRIVRAHVRAPTLSLGARGPAVAQFERRLLELHYAVPGVDGVFGPDDQQAVYAFQNVNRLEPTGVVTPALWSRLAQATGPGARYPGDHVEIDKTRQVLFLVRGGKVTLVSHVSTGATGNTPVGLWHVYGKVPGWSWVLWYPSYFLRGFAIHGYPYVPTYPASHGCIRIPMWLAPKIYPQIPIGSAIYIYV
jgi:N-acetylmuramoyl-L-alanine amidase